MATWDDVGRAALVLPGASQKAPHEWAVHGKVFVWERPLRRRDLDELGAAAPDGPVVAFYVADEGEKLALVGDDSGVFFTTTHFVGYPVVLARLDDLPVPELGDLVRDGWLARAPTRLAATYLAATDGPQTE
ncbi:MmcQ/YjbR family DNA-binding protein [Oerskovia flava]|uniref:MmcQ/YjbR family DNA-binding protein n=1 Tax=Oerskovia flava TaxID=2986422 RepID=UPI0022401FC8|nr:MmcQ/YjbR family DNA-binding protein [Oerskovia sp. JB1-3-2]